MDLHRLRLLLILGIALIVCCSSCVVLVLCQYPEIIGEAEESFKQAFIAVNEADTSGAESNQIIDLTDQLNDAKSFIDQAKHWHALGNSTHAHNAATQAIDICNLIEDQANSHRDEAVQRSLINQLILFTLIPVAALISTVFFHYGYKWFLRREAERGKDM